MCDATFTHARTVPKKVSDTSLKTAMMAVSLNDRFAHCYHLLNGMIEKSYLILLIDVLPKPG